jgi:HD-like signal output (HDOD) protein
MMESLWLHSLACGYMAAGIARKRSLQNVETYFFLGIVHDIGKVVLLKALADFIEKKSSIKAEEVLPDIDLVHIGIARLMLKRWNYATEIIRAVTLQEQPELPADADRLMLVLRLANRLVEMNGYTVYETPRSEELSEIDALSALSLSAEDIESVVKEVAAVMDGASKHF